MAFIGRTTQIYRTPSLSISFYSTLDSHIAAVFFESRRPDFNLKFSSYAQSTGIVIVTKRVQQGK